MTPALKAMVEAMGREFLRQTEESDEAPVCQFETQTLRVTDVYGGSFDLEKVARAGLKAMHYNDPDKPAFIATAHRHEIRPLVLISAYNELLERMREP